MESRFTGSVVEEIGLKILTILVVGITFGLGTPWAVCLSEGWYAKHTIIDGHQLVFDGKGIQLFGNYIKWFFLTIITLGIYGFWLSIKMKQWVVMHTHHEDVGAVNTMSSVGNGVSTPQEETAGAMSFGDRINAFSQTQSEETATTEQNYSEQTTSDYAPSSTNTYSANIHTDEVAENNYQSPFGSSFNATSATDTYTEEEVTPSPDYEPEDFHVDADGNTYYLDENGNPYYLDSNGNPYYVDEEGNPFYVDENGRPFYIDENGNPHYFES